MTPRTAPLVVGIMVALFLAAMDATITSTIMPSIVGALGGLDLYPWVGTAFMLASTLTTPLYGKLSDRLGHKRLMVVAVCVFLLGSALCGAARSMPAFIAARTLQGMGAGGLFTMTFVVFGLVFPPEQRGSMQGLLSGVWGIASVAGPLVGAFIAEYASWRWAFYFNVPTGLLAIALIGRYLHLPAFPRSPHPMDTRGIVLFAVGVPACLWALLDLCRGDAGIAPWGALGVGLAALGALAVHERRVAEPFLPVSLLRSPICLPALGLGFMATATLFSNTVFVPLYVQGALALAPLDGGRQLMGMSLGWVTGSWLCGRTLNLAGFRALGLIGAVFMSAGSGLMALATAGGAALERLLAANVVLGLGMGFVATSTLIAIQSAVPRRTMGTATSGLQISRTLGGTIGLSLLGGVQLGAFRAHVAGLGTPADPALAHVLAHPQVLLDPLGRAAVPAGAMRPVAEALGASIHQVFVLAFACGLAALLLAWRMPAASPAEVAARAGD